MKIDGIVDTPAATGEVMWFTFTCSDIKAEASSSPAVGLGNDEINSGPLCAVVASLTSTGAALKADRDRSDRFIRATSVLN